MSEIWRLRGAAERKSLEYRGHRGARLGGFGDLGGWPGVEKNPHVGIWGFGSIFELVKAVYFIGGFGDLKLKIRLKMNQDGGFGDLGHISLFSVIKTSSNSGFLGGRKMKIGHLKMGNSRWSAGVHLSKCPTSTKTWPSVFRIFIGKSRVIGNLRMTRNAGRYPTVFENTRVSGRPAGRYSIRKRKGQSSEDLDRRCDWDNN